MPQRKPETEEQYQQRLAVAFATWRTARVSRMDEGFLLCLEDGTLEDTSMHINTGDEKKDLRMIGFAIGTRGVEELYCTGDLSIRPIEPAGELPPYSEEIEEDTPPDPAVEEFLKKNRLLFG